MVENPRVQRLKEKLTTYNFIVDWQKGENHSIPDALSRSPVNDPTPDDVIDEQEIQSSIDRVTIRSASVIGPDDKMLPTT